MIENLATQLRRGPVRLRLRQLQGIEFLLSVVEASKSYPFDFVCHGITGFRPRDSRQESELLKGASLREDLLALAEDLSSGAGVSALRYGEPLYTVSELATRFDVSTKTIFRWRRRGLVGWRFLYEDRRERLAFPERCVQRFVAENVELVQRGAAFSQLREDERENIIVRARALVDGGERTVNAVAKRIGGETGRAVETIRLILKAYDEAHPKGGIFNRSKLKVDADDARMRVWEAYQDGASLESLAARFERPIAWAYATITEMRARELKARPIEYVPSDEFDAPDADEVILNDPAARAPMGEATPEKRIPRDLPPYLQQLFRLGLLTAEGERTLFRQMNYLKWKADQARLALDPETATARELDEVESLQQRAAMIKNTIVQANLRLVVSIAKRHAGLAHDFFEVVSDGNVSVMRAVDRFDYSRGFKFSTYASWAIMKNYARKAPEARLLRDRYQTGREELLEAAAGPPLDERENDFLPALRETLERMLAALDQREQAILRQRYGLDRSHPETQTLEQIGQRLGVSKERIRQLEARAMAKLREGFADSAKQILGVA
jgi:RNA polymerase sigma factor (sigma-70 family)